MTSTILETDNYKYNVVIDVTMQDPAWDNLANIEQIVKDTALKALESAILPKEAVGRDLEASLVLANDDLLQVLNNTYREKDKPTNILTFVSLDSDDPLPEGVLSLGDVFLSYETLMQEAQDQGKFITDHIRHLVVHGVLHLLGYDHETEDDATDMETLEIRILESLGIQNPYTLAEYQL
ncbi:MAG: rRNA maturation RNase YbeY [Pseudomonadota bacterium]